MKSIILALVTIFASVVGGPVISAHAEGPVKILFVDTGNTGRSITAETIARIHAAGTHKAALFISRGLDMNPFERRTEMNFQILWAERGVDLSAHRAEQLAPADVKHADLVLTMTQKHKTRVIEANPDAADKTFTLVEYATGGKDEIDDAFGKPLEFYQKTLAALDTLVPQAVDRAVREGAPKKP